jgi:hypothetical protein
LEAKPLSWKELGPWLFWLWHLLQALDGKFSVGAQEGIGTWGLVPTNFWQIPNILTLFQFEPFDDTFFGCLR